MSRRRLRLHFSLHFETDFDKFERLTDAIGSERYEVLPYLDHGDWHRLCRAGDELAKRWIDRQVERADAVIVLIGAQTYSRPLVRYEIAKAAADHRALLGINLHGMPSPEGAAKPSKGRNPFDYIAFNVEGRPPKYHVHDWSDRAAQAFDGWIAEAVRGNTR